MPSRNFLRQDLTLRTNARRGICEVLRLAYDEIHDMEDVELKERVTELLIDALEMAKKMDARLNWYFDKYHDGSGGQGKDIPLMSGNKARRKMRWERRDEKSSSLS